MQPPLTLLFFFFKWTHQIFFLCWFQLLCANVTRCLWLESCGKSKKRVNVQPWIIRGNIWFNFEVSEILSVWLCTHMHAHVSVLGDLIPAGDRWTVNPVPLLRGKAGGWGPTSQRHTALEPNTPTTPRQYKRRLLPWSCSVSSRTPPGKKG